MNARERKGREEKEFNTSERMGGDPRRSPKDCESCQQGLLLPRKSPSVKTARSDPLGGEKVMSSSGGQSGLGKPVQLLVLLQFPDPMATAPQESHDLPGCLILLLGEKGAFVAGR